MGKPIEKYCGPAAIASALGISRSQVVDYVKLAYRECRTKRRGWMTVEEVARALSVAVAPAKYSELRRGSLGGFCIKERIPFMAGRPFLDMGLTLRQWVYYNCDVNAIVLVSAHFVHVKNGVVVEDNGHCPWNAKVRGVILVPEGPIKAPPVVLSSALPDSSNTGIKLIRRKIDTSEYEYSFNGFFFRVVWNWHSGADRWLWQRMGVDGVVGEGRTLAIVQQGIAEYISKLGCS